MLDFDAETKFPYGSKTSAMAGAVGHNLIHRNCGEVDKLVLGRCVKTGHAYISYWNQWLGGLSARLLTSFSTIYVHSLEHRLGAP